MQCDAVEPDAGTIRRVPARHDPKPLDPPSWWLGADRSGFTDLAVKLFSARQESLQGITLANASRQGIV